MGEMRTAAEEQYLGVLRRELLDGSYTPTHATKVYIPKKSGILRTVSLLSVEDQIVYQPFANTIADRLPKRVTRHAHNSVFAHIYAGRSSKWFYRKWTIGYRKFNAAEGVRFFVYGLGGFDSFWDASLEVDCELQERRVPSSVPSAPVLLGVADGQV